MRVKHKRPLIIGRKKFDQIVSHIKETENKTLQAEEEKRHNEYLRNGSLEMTANWKDHLRETFRQNEDAERKIKLEEKKNTENAEYKQILQNKQKSRLEQIAKAELLLQNLKPGPKLLQSAAMASECIQGNIINLNIKKEYQRLIRKQDEEDNKKFLSQSLPWIEEEKKRGLLLKKNIDEYKKDIFKTIQENEKRKNECKNQTDQIEKCILEQLKIADQTGLENERKIQEEKKEKTRKNIMETLKMSEQCRERERCENEIDGKIMELTLEGQKKIDRIKAQQLIKIRRRHHDFIEANVKRIEHIFKPDYIEKEEESYQKKLKELDLEYEARKQASFEKAEAQRLDRIKWYHEEMEKDKKRMEQMTEEYHFHITNRLKNQEINREFYKLQKDKEIKKNMSHLNVLDNQVKEKQRLEKEERELHIKYGKVNYSQEDSFFYDYANKLIKDAVAKDRPTYPIEKAIIKFKKERGIDLQKPIPSHLKSSINIGIRTPEPCDFSSSNTSVVSPLPRYNKYVSK